MDFRNTRNMILSSNARTQAMKKCMNTSSATVKFQYTKKKREKKKTNSKAKQKRKKSQSNQQKHSI